MAAKKASTSVAKKKITKIDCLDEANAKLKAAHEKKERDYAAEIKKLDDKEEELRLRLSKLEEKKEKVAADYGETEVSDDDLIEVNAGGKIVSARRGVLCQLKGKRLEALFSGRWEKKLQRDSNGRIFLDVNGDCFQAIVDYLNELVISAEDDQPLPPSTPGENRQMLHDHLQLFGLPYTFISGSNIIKDSSHAAVIDNWLEEDGSAGVMKLLYRSSRDGLFAESFHYKCDGNNDSDKDRTLIIIKTREGGGIVGGYSNTAWDSSGDYKEADKAFLFALSGFDISSPCKMKIKECYSDSAIDCDEEYGPAFGDRDMYVDYANSSVELRMGCSYQGGPTEDLNGGKEYNIKEMEVFQVSGTCMRKKQVPPSSQEEVTVVDRFAGEVNDAINEKWLTLQELDEEVRSLEESFKDEENFIDSIGSGDTNDIVKLNVSGTRMATNRAVLMFTQESVLAQQFDDTKWTEQGCKDMRVKVKDWEPYEVARWVKSIEGAQEDVSHLFETNGINGTELIALDKEGLKMLGVTRVGTICLLSDEISALKKTSSEGMETLIEHSPYCFGKILDYLRMKYLHSIGLIDEPSLPTVCDEQKIRFEKVVKYYFPGESSKFIWHASL